MKIEGKLKSIVDMHIAKLKICEKKIVAEKKRPRVLTGHFPAFLCLFELCSAPPGLCSSFKCLLGQCPVKTNK